MTIEEIKNTPELVDFMLDKSIILDSRIKLHTRLEELCRLAIKELEQESCECCEDCIRRSDIGLTDFEIVMCNGDYKEGLKMLLDKIEKALSVTPQPKPKTEKCKWIRYDYRTICPQNHDIDNPYWRIPENTECLKYCPYCGKEIEVVE